MARLFCMLPEALERAEKLRLRTKRIKYRTQAHNANERKRLRSPVMRSNKFDVTNGDSIRDSPIPMYAQNTQDLSPLARTGLETHIRDIRCAFRQSEKQTYSQACAMRQNLEWATLAMVIDRLFFYIYLLTIMCSLMLIFPLKF